MQDQISVQLEKLHAYEAMKRDEDMRVPAAQALYQRAQTLSVKWSEESAWFQPELLRIPENQLRGWLQGADLKVYQHYSDDLLQTKAHILSVREGEFAFDPELDVECLRISHYCRGYYVYRYADSYCAATAIAKRILGNERGAREQWMNFLKTGHSMYAIDMLKVAGVHMSSPRPIEDAMALFEQLLKELEQPLKS